MPGNFEIRPPGDYFESEADRMADDVLRMDKSSGLPKPIAGSVGTRQQLSAGSVSSSNGEPLSDSLRAHYEPRFGHDFSAVRVHAGRRPRSPPEHWAPGPMPLAMTSCSAPLNSTPETAEGKQLLAHELAHVVQQDRGALRPSIQRRLILTGNPADTNLTLRILESASGLKLLRKQNQRSFRQDAKS